MTGAADAAAPSGEGADPRTHALPRFEGRASRRHLRHGMRPLRLRAAFEGLRRRDLGGLRTMVLFAGWPRSGHSLVGALLGAHPEARIAHELDAVGLFAKGMPARRLPPLMAWSAEGFAAAGHWWNGYRYAVEDAPAPRPPVAVGDKKGDWASRWCAADPGLPARLAAATPLRLRWILVTRHPLDNVATMSLREGRLYDRLRIDPPPEGFSAALAAAQAEGRIARAASDAMIDDYRALAAATAGIAAQVDPEDWLHLAYEDLVRDPPAGLGRLAAFAGLPADPAWTAAAAGLLRGGGRSRERVEWRPEQRALLDATCRAHGFLRRYADG